MRFSLFVSLICIYPTILFSAADQAIATVNGVEIKKSFFDNSYKSNLMFVSDKKVTPEKVLEDLINRELGIQKAKKQKLDADPTVTQKMLDVLYHAQISKDLEPRLRKINVTDEDVKKYYKEKPEYRTAQILFRVKAIPEKDEAEAALNKAMEVYNSIKQKPESFASFADKYSQNSTAPLGGDMGFQPAVAFAPEYFAAIKGKANGFITPPVRSQFGYHIIKVLAVKPLKEINMAQYKKFVYDEKRDAIIAQYFAELKKEASITIDKNLLK
jgi:parvulin-like peptidyl-prolyl isomerase